MKTPVKVSMKVQKIAGAFCRMSMEHQSPLAVFLRDKTIFDFFEGGAWCNVCNTRTCKQKVSYFHVFPENGRSHFLPREKISCFRGKKIHLSRWYKKNHVPAWPLLEKPSFQKVWRKYHISVHFFQKDHLSFSV